MKTDAIPAQSPSILRLILLIGIYVLVDQLVAIVLRKNSEVSYYVGLGLVVFFGYGAYSKILYRFVNPVIIAIGLSILAINILLIWAL